MKRIEVKNRNFVEIDDELFDVEIKQVFEFNVNDDSLFFKIIYTHITANCIESLKRMKVNEKI